MFVAVIANQVARRQETDENSFYVPYGYVPTRWTCYLLLILFGISSALHLGQGIYKRVWWLLPTALLCGLLECIGWASRLWSSIDIRQSMPFTIQITTTIMAPTPLLAANFVILGRIIQRLGNQYSRLRPNWYTIIFCTADVVSLVIQGVGGGIASSASQRRDIDGTEVGGNIMLGGIAFQMAIISIFAIVGGEFYWRYFSDRPIRQVEKVTSANGTTLTDPGRGIFTSKLVLSSTALVLTTTFLWIRAVYRVIELADGWDGGIITTELYFNVLDGAMIVLVMFTVNFVHPGWFLSEKDSSDKSVESKMVSLREI